MKPFPLLLVLLGFCGKSVGQTDMGRVTADHFGPLGGMANAHQVDSLVATLAHPGAFEVGLLTSDSLLYDEAMELSVRAWEPVDLDGNGRTDLVLNGRDEDGPVVLCVFDEGDNQYAIMRVTDHLESGPLFAKPISLPGRWGILYLRRPEPEHFYEMGSIKIDSLILRDGGMVEFNRFADTRRVLSIHYRTTMCYGTCPVFELIIDESGKVIYRAIQYNDAKGTFKALMDSKRLGELVGLIQYLGLPHLKSSYAVNWTDDQSCTLAVTYDDGTVTTISDYGLRGTFGLKHLYRLLFDLRNNQGWRRVKQ